MKNTIKSILNGMLPELDKNYQSKEDLKEPLHGYVSEEIFDHEVDYYKRECFKLGILLGLEINDK